MPKKYANPHKAKGGMRTYGQKGSKKKHDLSQNSNERSGPAMRGKDSGVRGLGNRRTGKSSGVSGHGYS